MAKKWLDSIEKQKRSNLKEHRDRHTDRQAGRRLDSTPSENVAMATRVGPLVGPNISGLPIWHTNRLIGDFVPNFGE